VATIFNDFAENKLTKFRAVFHPAGWTIRIFQWRVTQKTSNPGQRIQK